MPTLKEYQDARDRLRGISLHTPLVPLHSYRGQSDILLKPEIHQAVTSFKIRGVFNAVASLTPMQREQGLMTVSAGNTAQALAWCGRHFGVPARSLMPDSAPATKIAAVKSYGGEPVLVPTTEVFRFLKEHGWEDESYVFIHPWTNRDVQIGHGTIGLEIFADQPDVDTVYVPVGGGALICGVAGALKVLNSSARIIAVEPSGCPALHESFRIQRPATVECHTMCDGVAVPYITEELFPLLQKLVDEVVLVSEDAVKAAIKRLALGNRMMVEGSAALSVAAALSTPASERGATVCLVTGGSIDPDKFASIINNEWEGVSRDA